MVLLEFQELGDIRLGFRARQGCAVQEWDSRKGAAVQTRLGALSPGFLTSILLPHLLPGAA